MAETRKVQKFEDALKRLEEIVEKLEAGDQPLEKSLGLFEEGIKLARFCSTKLNEAEKKISLLIKNKEGELELKSFDTKDENLFEAGEEKNQ